MNKFYTSLLVLFVASATSIVNAQEVGDAKVGETKSPCA